VKGCKKKAPDYGAGLMRYGLINEVA
jgi:hypothetical protein